MKFHRYTDGEDRATIRVDFNVTTADMATVITAWFSSEFYTFEFQPNDPRRILHAKIKERLPSVRKTLEHLREALQSDGFTVPFYRVGDQKLEDVRDAVKERIEWLLTKQQEHLKEVVPAE